MNLRQSVTRPLVRVTGLLALLAYLPALTAAPGRMPSDSKLYLYLDPGRFIGDAASTFDPLQFAGWVPHQHIAYLWPSGPWFWLFETVGVPDWIAHRLWIGSLMLAAGLGVRWCARQLGFGQTAALAGAIVYQVSPYVLPYVSRTSVMLLPWAGVGWIVGLTIRATQRRSWRDPALIALTVFTVGAVNATALAMIVPAPTLWLVHATWQRSITWRQALAVAGRVVTLTIPVSVWWIVMLMIQGRFGAEVLPYSESLADVSLTSTGPEVWRSLGYWLFYVRDPYAATTTASLRYLSSTAAIAVSYLVPLVALLGLTLTRWAHRRFALLLVVAGAVLAIGVHPIADRSPLMRLLAGSDERGLALALRSSTRALPVMNLGLALGVAALVATGAGTRIPRLGWRTHWAAAGVVSVVAVVNLPSLWTGAFVDPALERDQTPPAAWRAAADALDESGTDGRVLQLPGAEFGAFRWGYTVDQPLPGLTDKPLVTRDLLPLGSPGAMDLLDALDDRIQDGVFEPSSLAPVARWLGVDTVWVANDLAYDRFRTARPQVLGHAIDEAPGLEGGTPYGSPFADATEFPMVDERSLADPAVTESVAPVVLHDLDAPGSVIRASDRPVVVSGSGDGLVDLAAAGMLDGGELVRYSASLPPDERPEAIETAGVLLVTDSNRDRARHWRSSQDVTGYTESDQPGLGLLRYVASDQRLPVFAPREVEVDPATQTVARQIGAVTATATSYGEPFAYLPEHRPFAAIDGDPATAWLVGEHADPVGEVLRLRFDAPQSTIGIVQPDPGSGRRITELVVRADDGAGQRIALDERSLAPTGMPIELSSATMIDIEIAAVAGGEPFTAGAVSPVGIAEVVTGMPPSVEVVRPPSDGLRAITSDTELALVLTRLRVDPMDRWRDDPEPTLVRELDLPDERSFMIDGDVRVDARAPDAALAAVFGWPASASSRLTGSIGNAGVSAIDGDTSTAWITAFGEALGATLRIAGVTQPIDRLRVVQPDGSFSSIRALTVRSAGQERTVAIDRDAAGAASVTIEPPLPPPDEGGVVEVTVSQIEAATTLDRRFGDIVELPAAIGELVIPGAPVAVGAASSSFRAECVPLVAVGEQVVAFTVELGGADAIAGTPATVTPCQASVELKAGTHRLTEIGSDLPLQLDRVVLDTGVARTEMTAGPTVTVTNRSRLHREVTVVGCIDGCWLVFGEGYNDAWRATVGGSSLGDPQLVDGGFNGWWLPPTSTPITVQVEWSQQRPLDIAFLITAIGLLATIALVVVTRRQQPLPVTTLRLGWIWHEPVAPIVPQPIRRTWSFGAASTAYVVAWAGLAAILIQPEWAAWGALAGFAAALWQRPRLAEWTALASVAVVAALVVGRERRNSPFPGGGWPGVFASLHALAVFAVVCLLVAALFADDAERDPGPGDF